MRQTRVGLVALTAIAVFVFSWLFRFNDPDGAFAGLTDDHFFYLVRGWQILFGELPVRDFVDHGAPLYYYLAAAVQMVSRGTYSEVLFSVTLIAAGAAGTFWLAQRASGSIVIGLVGAAFQILLVPRFYNYPKILVYVVAVPLLWRFADRPGRWPLAGLAVVTAVGFLLRHDHGFFVALAFGVLLLLLAHLPWRQRWRHLLVYSGLVIALLTPYLVFIQMNGGVVSYLQQASAWAARDRDRAPVVWPGLFDNPDGVSEAARSGAAPGRAIAVVRDNEVAWLYYFELALPALALATLLLVASGGRPEWPNAGAKIGVVIVLAVVLNAGFLRSPLAARLADPSVPHAILIAWLIAVLPKLLISRERWRPALRSAALPLGLVVAACALPLVFTYAATMTKDLYRRLDKAGLVERPGKSIERAQLVAGRFREDWELSTWEARTGRPELITLAMYLNACTRPTDRVFIQQYLPQVIALSRRGFAGGHADLRPGFFNTMAAQTLTLQRLRRQSVPIMLLDTGESYENFRESFPLIAEHIDRYYWLAGTHTFDGRFGISLFVQNGTNLSAPFQPLGWPCPR